MLVKQVQLFFKASKLVSRSLIYKRTFLSAPFKELDKFPNEIKSYESLHRYSIDNPDHFWGVLGKSRMTWFKEFQAVSAGDFNDDKMQLNWFIDGKLNASVNCVDRHFLNDPNKVALIWDKDEPGKEEYMTYEELYKTMNQLANMFKANGIRKGDRVAIYMPTTSMTVAAMLACTRIGAVHCVVFAGFSAEALASRINDSECTAVLTMNEGLRGGKTIDLKQTVDKAVSMSTSVKNVFVFRRTEKPFNSGVKDVLVNDVINQFPTECKPEVMDSEDPLFMLYTSGSTGKPKGLIHTHAGYLLHVALSQQLVFNYQPNDVFGCLADVGWITGHSYVVYGPLMNGGTTVLFESTPVYPDPGRYWETVERLKINQLYLAPTSLRLLIKHGDEWVTKYDRSSLKCLGSVGEPINTEAWHWFNEVVGEKKCKIADTWWQTETGGNCITPMPCDDALQHKPGMAMLPFLGVNAVLVDENSKELAGRNSKGMLCIKQPWPGMARTIYGNHERFLETYMKPFPGYYFTGDGAIRDEDGHFQITGRVDDVMNVSGHRIGTAEVEDALSEHPLVVESAVVGFPHDVLGEGIYAFIILMEGDDECNDKLKDELKAIVKKKISGFAVPHHFLIVPNLPKTRSGKIMRRILRKVAANLPEEFGDISTLAEPAVVEDIVRRHNLLKQL